LCRGNWKGFPLPSGNTSYAPGLKLLRLFCYHVKKSRAAKNPGINFTLQKERGRKEGKAEAEKEGERKREREISITKSALSKARITLAL
jgi:hypothetical protein